MTSFKYSANVILWQWKSADYFRVIPNGIQFYTVLKVWLLIHSAIITMHCVYSLFWRCLKLIFIIYKTWSFGMFFFCPQFCFKFSYDKIYIVNIIYWNVEFFFSLPTLALNSRKNYPPGLVIINNDDNSINNCFVAGGGIQVDIGNDAKDALTNLLFCYYVWDLSYPKQYQLLGFLQTSVLRGQRKQIW
jgi:hypothetical protein